MIGSVTDATSIAKRYVEAWNTTDPAARQELVAEVFAENAGYTDPLAAVRGRAAIDQLIAAAQPQFGGMPLTLASNVDAHHDQARFTWHLASPGSSDPVVVGFDVIVLRDGRIAEVYGFIDKMP
jgi:hypothetical protein